MGRNNQARRAAKAKQRARQRRQQRGPDSWRDAEHPDSGPIFSDADRAELAWLAAAEVGVGRGTGREVGLDLLTRLPTRVVLSVVDRLLREHISLLWEHGWQPRELHRQARIGSSSTGVARVVEAAVAADCTRRLAAAVDLHPQWRAQAESIGDRELGSVSAWIDRAYADLARAEGSLAAYAVIAGAISVLFNLPAIDVLIPPPGQRVLPDARRTHAPDPKLERVRALLAKAESTEFEAEATALTAKAQELITRHAIDTALLSAGADGPDVEPAMIRLPIDAPYADAKSLLLQTVAQATRCHAVFVPRLSYSNVVGLPDDVGAVELLFTSLLVQAQHALVEAGRSASAGAQRRSQSFRSAFLLAYAQRIGERLTEINAHVFADAADDSASFLPVLHSQADALSEFMAERFGEIYSSQVRGGYSTAGRTSGRLAADQAKLAAGHLDAAGEGGDEALF